MASTGPAIVAARSLNGVIGRGDEIPWRVKGEQKLFREITMNGVLIMGRKTFESIGRPLPGRVTVIVTRDDYDAPDCVITHGLDEALALAADMDKPVFIAGGGQIYEQSLPLVQSVHLSTIQTRVDGDVYFPEFPTSEFSLEREEMFESNIDYIYQYFERKET